MIIEWRIKKIVHFVCKLWIYINKKKHILYEFNFTWKNYTTTLNTLLTCIIFFIFYFLYISLKNRIINNTYVFCYVLPLVLDSIISCWFWWFEYIHILFKLIKRSESDGMHWSIVHNPVKWLWKWPISHVSVWCRQLWILMMGHTYHKITYTLILCLINSIHPLIGIDIIVISSWQQQLHCEHW